MSPTVQLPALLILFLAERPLFAIADSINPAAVDALAYEEVSGGDGSPVPQSKVIL